MTGQPHPQLWITQGATVTNEGREYVILAIADINIVLAKDLESGVKVLLKIGELGSPKVIGDSQTSPPADSELLEVPEDLWKVAEAPTLDRSATLQLLHSFRDPGQEDRCRSSGQQSHSLSLGDGL